MKWERRLRELFSAGMAVLLLASGAGGSALASDVGGAPGTADVQDGAEAAQAGREEFYILLEDGEEYVYTGEEITPAVKVMDGAGEELDPSCYSLTFRDNREAGTASLRVEGTGETASWGASEKKFQIVPAAVENLEIALEKEEYLYDGKPKRPGVTVTFHGNVLTEGSDYTVEYLNDTKAGTASAVVKGTGNFTGTVTLSYVIRQPSAPKEPASEKKKGGMTAPVLTKAAGISYRSIRVTWKKVSKAQGYVVYRSTSENGTYRRAGKVDGRSTARFEDTKCTCGKTYYYKVRAFRKISGKTVCSPWSKKKSGAAVPGKPVVTRQTEPYEKKVILRWKEVEGAHGYEVYRSSGKNGTYRKVKALAGADSLKWTDAGLKKGATYYYKIRAYRKVNGRKVYGAYSDVYKKSSAGWVYKDGYKLYYNSKGKLVKDVGGLIGRQDSYVLKVNKQKNVVTVYARDGKRGYIIPVKSFVCATGKATPSGIFYTPRKYRWLLLVGPCYGQWCTGIEGDILFHSSPYKTRNPMDLDVPEYNKMGTTCSHGCVRLKAGDAKWIYDNCSTGTKVVIYSSPSAGPFGKPKAERLPSYHRWDPTDPNLYGNCKKRGCH